MNVNVHELGVRQRNREAEKEWRNRTQPVGLDRERQTERQTETQRHRDTDRQRHRETERQRERHRET